MATKKPGSGEGTKLGVGPTTTGAVKREMQSASTEADKFAKGSTKAFKEFEKEIKSLSGAFKELTGEMRKANQAREALAKAHEVRAGASKMNAETRRGKLEDARQRRSSGREARALGAVGTQLWEREQRFSSGEQRARAFGLAFDPSAGGEAFVSRDSLRGAAAKANNRELQRVETERKAQEANQALEDKRAKAEKKQQNEAKKLADKEKRRLDGEKRKAETAADRALRDQAQAEARAKRKAASDAKTEAIGKQLWEREQRFNAVQARAGALGLSFDPSAGAADSGFVPFGAVRGAAASAKRAEFAQHKAAAGALGQAIRGAGKGVQQDAAARASMLHHRGRGAGAAMNLLGVRSYAAHVLGKAAVRGNLFGLGEEGSLAGRALSVLGGDPGSLGAFGAFFETPMGMLAGAGGAAIAGAGYLGYKGVQQNLANAPGALQLQAALLNAPASVSMSQNANARGIHQALKQQLRGASAFGYALPEAAQYAGTFQNAAGGYFESAGQQSQILEGLALQRRFGVSAETSAAYSRRGRLGGFSRPTSATEGVALGLQAGYQGPDAGEFARRMADEGGRMSGLGTSLNPQSYSGLFQGLGTTLPQEAVNRVGQGFRGLQTDVATAQGGTDPELSLYLLQKLGGLDLKHADAAGLWSARKKAEQAGDTEWRGAVKGLFAMGGNARSPDAAKSLVQSMFTNKLGIPLAASGVEALQMYGNGQGALPPAVMQLMQQLGPGLDADTLRRQGAAGAATQYTPEALQKQADLENVDLLKGETAISLSQAMQSVKDLPGAAAARFLPMFQTLFDKLDDLGMRLQYGLSGMSPPGQ